MYETVHMNAACDRCSMTVSKNSAFSKCESNVSSYAKGYGRADSQFHPKEGRGFRNTGLDKHKTCAELV